MLIVADRIKERTTTVGVGNLTLAGAVVGFRTFSSVMGSNDVCYYTIQSRSTEWEVGIGTLTSPPVLTRDTILASSNSGLKVNLKAGTKDVFLTSPARNVLGGNLTPDPLTANVDDYDPVGGANANVFRLSSTLDVDITGLAGGSPGRFIVVENVGTFTIWLRNQSLASTAQNRFLFGSDFAVSANSVAILHYDEVDEGWRTFSSSGAVYTNLSPTPISIGGITAGEVFNNRSMQQMWDNLLYPYQSPGFGGFGISGQAGSLEVGATIPASVTFTWGTSNSGNVVPNSINIFDVSGGNIHLGSNLANTGSYATTLSNSITENTSTSYTFSISGTNTNSQSFSANATYSWYWRKFWGTNNSPELTAAQTSALTNNALGTGYGGTYDFAAGGYKYICFPNEGGGQINSIKDTSTGFSVAMAGPSDDAAYSHTDGGGFNYALVSGTNANGVAVNFRVYRSRFVLGGSTQFAIT